MRIRLGSLFSPAMFVALLALMISLSTASVAAVMISGKQIKKNTVASAQIKNKTIKTIDISPKARGQLKGQSGAAGADGAPGAKGAPGVPGAKGADGAVGPAGAVGAAGNDGPVGPVGPSKAHAVVVSTPTVYGNPGTTSYVPVLTLPGLPVGSYVVNAKAWAVGKSTNAFVSCELTAPGVAPDRTGAEVPKNEVYAALAHQLVFTNTGPGSATVTLDCYGRDAHVQHKRITAIKVGSIS